MSDDLTRGLREHLDATFDEAAIRAKAAALVDAASPPAASPNRTAEPLEVPLYPQSQQRSPRRGWVWPTAAFGLAAALIIVVVLARWSPTSAPPTGIDALAQAASSTAAVSTGDALIWSYAYTDVRDEVITRHDQTITSSPSGTSIETSREFPLIGDLSTFVPGDATSQRLPADADAFDGFNADEIRDLPSDPDDLVAALRERRPDDTTTAHTLMNIAGTASLPPELRAAAIGGLGVLGGIADEAILEPYDRTGVVVRGPELTWTAIVDPDTGAPLTFVSDPGTTRMNLEKGRWIFWQLDPIPEETTS